MPIFEHLSNGMRNSFVAMSLTIVLCLLAPVNGLGSEKAPSSNPQSATRFIIKGNRGLDEAALRKAAETELADFERFGGREADADDAAYKMEAAYRRSGFPFATVGYRLIKDPASRIAEFTISEGAQVILEKLKVVGNSVFEEKELTAIFENSRNVLLSKNEQVFIEADVLDGISEIERLYRSRGYLDATVEKPEIQYVKQNTRAEVTVRIEEGRQYLIHEVSFSGDTKREVDSELSKVRKMLVGQPYFPRQRFALQKQILQVYGNRGYADASAQIDATASERKEDIRLSAEIYSGPKVIIGAVEIAGNARTRDRFIQSRLQLGAGDVYSIDKKQESFRALYRTGLFSSVDISLKGTLGTETRTQIYRLWDDF